MAVKHRVWQFDVARAAAAFEGLTGYPDLFSANVTAIAERVRADPHRRFHLVMLRLDPTDEETWSAVLRPRPEDAGYEMAAANRLMLLLIGACTEARGIQAAPSYLAWLLGAAGWSRERVELLLHGARMSTFFTQVAPALSEVVSEMSWAMTGGWLDVPTAARLKGDFDDELPSLRERIPDVAAEQSSKSGLERARHELLLSQGLADLGTMLTQPRDGGALWIIED